MSTAHPKESTAAGGGFLGFWARNGVAANLLMIGLLAGGVWVALNIRQEVFPSYQLDIIDVRVPYPGASPLEVEDGVLKPIEENLRALTLVDRLVATASEGLGTFEIELLEGVDPNRALQEVQSAIDRVSFLPEDAERPIVELREERESTLWMVAHGPLSEGEIFEFAERLRRGLIALPELSQVELRLARVPEIAVEISEEVLRSLELTPIEVAAIIGRSAQDVPGGGVRTPGGEYLLRSSERRERASAYGDIVLLSRADGTRVRLEDVATLRDGFEDRAVKNRFNGGNGVFVTVWQTRGEKPLEISAAVRRYLDELKPSLPPGVAVSILRDRSEQYAARLNLLLKNGVFGLGLILFILGLFLEPKLAFWVAVGVPTAVIGSLLLLPVFDASINMITLFAFIVTLGIVVDDAVLVGENIFHRIQAGDDRWTAVRRGAQEMAVPVLFAVVTNVIAFLPLLFVPGSTGRFFAPLPTVVIAVFLISLVESLIILPSHLLHTKTTHSGPLGLLLRAASAVQSRATRGFEAFADRVFAPCLRLALKGRGFVLIAGAAFVALGVAYFASGRINYTFDPVITGQRVDAEIRTPSGSPFSETLRIADHIEAAGVRAAERLGGRAEDVVRGRMNVVGRVSENAADVNFILVPENERNFDEATFARVWREEIGTIAGLESLFFEWEEGPGSGAGMTIQVSGRDTREIEAAALDLAGILRGFRGVVDVKDGIATGKPQIDVRLRPEGLALGLSPREVGRQTRAAFFGAEALRFQRDRHEVKVMVRLPEAERRSLASVEDLMIRTPRGGEARLLDIAELEEGRAFTQIRRVDGQRVVEVTANVVPEIANINAVRAALEAGALKEWKERHRGASYTFAGRQREERRALERLSQGLVLSLIAIYALLAGLFRSHQQALIVVSIIPIGLASALLGHVLLGYDLSVVSLFGMIALAGLVVNGSLVLNEEMNRGLESGLSPFEAAFAASRRRLRPILLTSATTFAGLAPMILERDPQAIFLIPMAIALGFGSLVSGVAVLFTVPALRLLLVDLSGLFARGGGRAESAGAPSPEGDRQPRFG